MGIVGADHPAGAADRKLRPFGGSRTGWAAKTALYTCPRAATDERRGPDKVSKLLSPARRRQDHRLVSPMRELERDDFPSPMSAARLVIIGRGRGGHSLARAANGAGIEARLAASDDPGDCRRAAVLLSVPDEAIAGL